MKKLTKLLLIDWLYFEKQIIDFGDINFLTGKNSAGKSTIIDALQVVLLGDTSKKNFNKAANEKADRTIENYLRADSGSADANDVAHSRKGKTFETYIACEFFDDIEIKSFTIGVVFDCDKDGTYSNRFFIYEGKIPENCFIIEKLPMDIKTLRAYLKDNYRSQDMCDTVTKYRGEIISKFNVHTEKYFTMIKKAISFKPINDIQQFITGSICDVDSNIDITGMQENIRQYQQQEKLAEILEKKSVALAAIKKIYLDRNDYFKRWKISEYISRRAEIEKTEQEEQVYFKEIDDNKNKIKAQNEIIAELNVKKNELSKIQLDLLLQQKNSDIQKEIEKYNTEIDSLQKFIDESVSNTNKTITTIRHNADFWINSVNSLNKMKENLTEENDFAELFDKSKLIHSKYSYLQSFDAEKLKNSDKNFWTEYGQSIKDFKTEIAKSYFSVFETQKAEKTRLSEIENTIKKLSCGIKAYPNGLEEIRNKIEDLFYSENGRKINLLILADVIEMADENWRNVAEGYLNTQKFYFLVEPKDFIAVSKIYRKIKSEFGFNDYFGLIDSEKLRENEELYVKPNSLATKIKSGNEYAADYINYLLGNVICCENVQDLRQYRTAVSSDGLLYKNYVQKSINPKLWATPYIGRNSLGKALTVKKSEYNEYSDNIKKLIPLETVLADANNKENFLTEEFSFSALNDAKNIKISEENSLKIKGIQIQKGKLDLTWLQKITEKIAENEKNIKLLDIKIDECYKTINTIENENGSANEKIKNCDTIIENKKPQFENYKTGMTYLEEAETKYSVEYDRLKDLSSLFVNFSNHAEQMKTTFEKRREALINERVKYANTFPPCSFDTGNISNDEYDSEYNIIIKNKLPEYADKIKRAKESAQEQFQNEFIDKLYHNIEAVTSQVKDLNNALKNSYFGNDQYEFLVERNPDYNKFYDMITDRERVVGGFSLFTQSFLNKYQDVIDNLFDMVTGKNGNSGEIEKNIIKFTDYRTYLRFDLRVTDANGAKQRLSETLQTKSGGESQTPFYIAIVASFAQLYHVYESGEFNNTARIVIFDEAFNKMDGERIIECINLFRKSGLQIIMCTPPEKVPDIMGMADKTLLVYKENYKMHALPWTKNLENKINECENSYS